MGEQQPSRSLIGAVRDLIEELHSDGLECDEVWCHPRTRNDMIDEVHTATPVGIPGGDPYVHGVAVKTNAEMALGELRAVDMDRPNRVATDTVEYEVVA